MKNLSNNTNNTILTNKGEETMKNLNTMTKVELLAIAKAEGLKLYSKLNKKPLIELIEASRAEAVVVNEVVNNIESNTDNNDKGEKTMKRDALLAAIEKGNKEAISALVSKAQGDITFGFAKKLSKQIKGVAMTQIVLSAETPDYPNALPELRKSTNVAITQESNMLRAAHTEVKTVADSGLVLNMMATDEIVSISIDKSIYNKNAKDEKTRAALKAIRARVFNMLLGKGSESLNLLISTSGLSTIYTSQDLAYANMKTGDKVVTVKLAGVTASGLRSKSLVGAAVKLKLKGSEAVDCDRRVMILDKSIDGCFSGSFMEASDTVKGAKKFKKLKDKATQFKAANRLTQGGTASNVLGMIDTMLCVDNLASKSTFTNTNGEVVSAKDTKDGTITIAKSVAERFAAENNTPFNYLTYVGIWDQIRGAGLKCSADYKDKIDMITFAKHLIAKLESEIEYVIVCGTRFDKETKVVDGKTVVSKTAWAKVKEAKLVDKFFRNIEMIADTNAMKMTSHNNKFSPVRLKMAYQSKMNLSMVTAMACLLADPKNAPQMLIEKGLNSLAKRFANLGVKYSVENGVITNYDLDLNSFGLNNESQTMSYLYKCDPLKTLQLFPGVARSNFTNEIKGMKSMLTDFEVELDRSFYTVVQSDMAVLYGEQLLAENEMFCYNAKSDRVVITRHPISSPYASTVLNVVPLDEMIDRILALNISDFKKRHLVNYICMAKEVCIIPASHYLMEKHDGMDFDIDAVQIIEDKDIVDCLAKLPNRGSVIRDNEKANIARHMETSEEAAILKFMNNTDLGLVRPTLEKDIMGEEQTVEEECEYIKIDATQNKKKPVYTMDFVNQGEMIENFFNTELASVGELSNAFYNNCLILLTLLSDTVNDDTKQVIADAFKKFYNCSGIIQYKSAIDRTTMKYEVDKFDCTEAVFKFAECDGSVHSLIAYLEDCCDYNRFLAESSIDAAKNDYFVINMFYHNYIISTLGAKADCKAELVRNDKAFSKIAALHGLSERNFFELEMLKLSKKKDTALPIDAYVAGNGKMIDDQGREKTASLAIEDPLYFVKDKLVRVANRLIVLTAKKLEDVATSQEAINLRSNVLTGASIISESKVSKAIDASIEACKHSHKTLTLNLRESEEEEFDGISKVQFMKENVIAGIKNTMNHSLSDLSDYEVGNFVVNNIVRKVSDSKCGTINPALYKVFEAEMLAYLSEIGFNNAGIVGEEIAYVEMNKRYVNIANYVGSNVTVVDHHANLEDGAVLVTTNKKANIEGTIVNVDGKYYVQSTRAALTAAPEKGAYINVDLKSDRFCDDLSNVDVVSYEYKTIYNNKNKAKKLYSVVIAKDAMDNEYVAACLTVRDELTDLLKIADLSNLSIFSIENESKTITRVVYIPGQDYMNAVEALKNVEKAPTVKYSFDVPTGFDLTNDTQANTTEFTFEVPTFA